MTRPDSPDNHAGWELSFQSGHFPPRYQTTAAPNDTVVEWADTLPAGSLVLDVGCGVGRHLVYLGGRGFRLAGFDASPSGVRLSRQACAERRIELDARVSDMTSIPWPDATFDAALSTSVICHLLRADILKTMREIRRVLKPGGQFLVDFLHKDTATYHEAREQVAAGTLTEVETDTFVDTRPEPDPMDDAFLPHHFCDEADARSLLQSFEILRLWADLPANQTEGTPAKRGYWVAWARKPLSG